MMKTGIRAAIALLIGINVTLLVRAEPAEAQPEAKAAFTRTCACSTGHDPWCMDYFQDHCWSIFFCDCD